MSIAAAVENGTIKLLPDIHLPDGTRVDIVLAAPEPEPGDRSPLDWMGEFVGCIDGLPADLSDEHDHYLHGTPKHAGR